MTYANVDEGPSFDEELRHVAHTDVAGNVEGRVAAAELINVKVGALIMQILRKEQTKSASK